MSKYDFNQFRKHNRPQSGDAFYHIVMAMCALAGAFSTAMGAWNLVNARDTYAGLQELHRKRFEGWDHDWDM